MRGREPKSPRALAGAGRARALLEALRRCHEGIVADVRRSLARAFAARDYESAMALRGRGAGDWVYEIDAVADRWISRLSREVGRIVPARILCEGIGEVLAGRGEPAIRILVDPIDGTRGLMADLRCAWVLTGVAEERGGEPTTADLWLSLQSEIPASDRAHRAEYLAIRGRGCIERVIPIVGKRPARARRLLAKKRLDLRTGYYDFLRFVPWEAPWIAHIQADFLAGARRSYGLEPDRVFDDPWLCAAGQLWLVATGRARMAADLRGWIAGITGEPTVASHPYDLCGLLAATEAGAPVLAVDRDLTFPPLAAPLDLETNVSFVAFANETARRRCLPILRRALANFRRAAARRDS